MLTEKITWDHSANDIREALCISKDRAMEITGSIFFTEIDKAYVAHSIFGEEEEIPNEFKTKTAVLDSVTEELENENELIFATFEWTKHIASRNVNPEAKGMEAVMTLLYMMSNQNKKTFIREFKKRMNDED
jgi:hypothetical protein